MNAPSVRELGQQLRVDFVRISAAAGSGHPTSSMSAADLMAVLLDGGYLRMDTERPRQPGERPPDLLQGPRLAAVLRRAQGGGDHRRRRAPHVPQARLAARGPPDAAHPPTTSPPARSARASRSRVGVALAGKRLDRLPYRVWCCAATPRWPRARSGRRSSTRRSTSSTTSPRSSTSTGSARRARRWSAGTSTATCAAPRRSAGTRSRSTATTSTRSRRPTTGRRARRAAHGDLRRTKKGKGVKAVEDQPGKHGKPLDDPEAAIRSSAASAT